MASEPAAQPDALHRHVPILTWLPRYRRSWLRTDLVAGLTIVALLVPEGMAYAQIAGVPPETAFYAAPIGLLAFAIFSTSRQLVVAVSAVIASMSFATVSQIAPPNSPEFIVLTAALAVLTGLVLLVAGFLKLGRVAQYFSESVMVGFITGLALVIMIKQVPKLLGIEGGEGNFWERCYEIVMGLPKLSVPTLITGILSLILLIVLERYFHRIPAALVALIVGIAFSTFFDLEARGVEVIGEIPAGLVPPQWPDIPPEDWLLLLPGAIGLALVAFAEAIGPLRSFAQAHKYRVDTDQELIGLGASNFGAGLFQGFPIGSSLSKSAANDQAGAHTQMSGIVAAAGTALVALFFTQFFYALPEAVLGAIVIVAVSGMVKIDKFRYLYHARRTDFVLAIVALLAVLTFETLEALLIAVLVSLLALVWRVSRPRLAVLGRAPDTLDFRDVQRHPDVATIPGLLIVRPENGLFFANAEGIREEILTQIEASEQPVNALLLDLSATTDLDVPGAETLGHLLDDLSERDIRLIWVRAIAPVHQMLDQAGLSERITPEDVFTNTPAAVLDYLVSQGDMAGVQDLLRRAALSVRTLLDASEYALPANRDAALAVVAESLDLEIDEDEQGPREVPPSPG